MQNCNRLILTINPGSTSIKIALFQEDKCIVNKNLQTNVIDFLSSYPEIERDEDNVLMQLVFDFIREEKIAISKLDMVVSRGGPTPFVKSGAYNINDLMLKVLKHKPLSKHAAMAGPEIAYKIAKPLNIPAIIYDSPVTDEGDEIAHISGLPEIRRNLTSHALNARMMCRRLAEEMGLSYEDLNLVVAHLGGGISVAAHKNGRIPDAVFIGEGPMAPTRSGKLPARELAELCYSGKYTLEEMKEKLLMTGGLMAYLNTSDAQEVEKMINDGDSRAKNVYYAMSYQVSKCIAEMTAVLSGEVDGILLTGGMAHSKMLTGWISERISYLAPVHILPGEDEMKALALGGLRVLDGKEIPKEYDILPKGYATVEEFYNEFGICDDEV